MSSRLLYCIYYFIFSRATRQEPFIAGASLLGKSFRMMDTNEGILLSFHREFLKALIRLYKSKSGVSSSATDSNSAIFDAYRNDEDLRKSYIKFYSKIEVKNFIPREEIGTESYPIPKLQSLFGLVVLYIGILPLVFVSKYGAPLLLIFQEYLEMKAVTSYVQVNEIDHLYHFNIYEKESNFLSYFLKLKFDIKTTKCPSEVPLAFWNRKILCDDLVICNAYQLDELNEFGNTIKYKNKLLWGPEQGHLVDNLYSNRNAKVDSKKILGYISTGAWVREKEGHIDQGFEMVKNELMMLNFFNTFLNGKNLKLIVYLHPREKLEKNYSETVKKYDSILNKIEYEFAPRDVPSSELFMKSDLVVSFYSSLLFERLYFGFKTIFYTLYSDDFPIKNSDITNICAFDEEKLEALLLKCLPMTDFDFFREMKIDNYPYLNRQA